jgi:Right handed beta helix region
MSSNKSWLTAAAVASALFAISAPAHAQATRTWVSGVGSDADPCSRTAPCKTFAGAISKTATNGFINCLDPAGYGAVTITRSMTIDCHETLGSILAGQEGTTGIIINVTGAADPKDTLRTVRLRNIDVAGINLGSNGITILAAASVIMEDMSITGMTKNGISDTRTEGKTSLVVKNSIIANNAGSGVSALAQDNNVVLDNVHSVKNAYGAAFGKTNNGAINRSVFSNNAVAGVESDPGGSMMMNNSVVSYNTTGIASSGGAVGFANSDVMFNGTGVAGSTLSFGNNRMFANTVAGVAPSPAGGPSTDLGQQ